jgi:hypothetical protein
MSPISTTAMFQSVGIFSGFLLPVAILVLFVVLVLPGLARTGTKPETLALAAYCYLAEALGVILMTAGGLPAVYAVVSHQLLASNTYLGLLILFIIGGIIYLRHDAKLRTVDADSKAIPAALFFYSWKFIGLVIVLFTCLSFVLDWLVNTAPGHTDTWTVDLVMLLYGLLLCWFTIPVPVAEAPSPLLTTKRPVFKPRSTMAMAAKAKKPAIKKTSTSQKKR